jgi:hypothetical protein
MRRGPLESGSPDNVACHSLASDDLASRPPVQATLWLAALGLDWARPRRGETFLIRGNGRLNMNARTILLDGAGLLMEAHYQKASSSVAA